MLMKEIIRIPNICCYCEGGGGEEDLSEIIPERTCNRNKFLGENGKEKTIHGVMTELFNDRIITFG